MNFNQRIEYNLYSNNNSNNFQKNYLNNNIPMKNNYIGSSNMKQKNFSSKRRNYQNNNINIINDERLNLCLYNLGLKKYIINFQRNQINFDNFLSLTNKDFGKIQIPNNIINIIQNFIISYLKFGSLYTIEEIKEYFYIKSHKEKVINHNIHSNKEMYEENIGNFSRKNHSINNNRNYFMMNNMYNKQNNNKNIGHKNNSNDRPKSQNQKPINYDFLINNNICQNNYKIMNNQNLNHLKNNQQNNPNNRNNIKNINNNKRIMKNNNINRQNNFNKSISNNINISSFYSNSNNTNYISPSIDNFSHIAIKEKYSNIDNLIKINQFREMNNDNFYNLKRNLSNDSNLNNKNNRQSSKNSLKNNLVNQNKKVPNQNNIIQQMNNVIKKIQSRKENNNNIMTQSNIDNSHKENSLFGNSNKGYHSDGYLKEKKKLQQYNNLINNNIKKQSNNSYNNLNNNNLYNNLSQNSENNIFNNRNNIYSNGYEINSYYTGDTSHLDSLRGKNKVTPDIKKIKGKNGKIYYSKSNKIKKINEEQTRKIEQLLGYNSSSVMTKTPFSYANKIFNTRGNIFKKNKGMVNHNFENYNINDDELYSFNNNNSKTNLTSYTYIQNTNFVKPFNLNPNSNEINKQLIPKKKTNNKLIKEAYSPTINRFIKQKNLVNKGKIKHKNMSNNKFDNARIFNNFNNYVNNLGNISSNLCDDNDMMVINQNMKLNDNRMDLNMNFPNKTSTNGRKNFGPIQIQFKNEMKINNNYINDMNNNRMRNNNFVEKHSKNIVKNNKIINNNNKINKNYSVDNKKIQKNNQIPNNYVNTFINVNNYDILKKRNAKSFDINTGHLNIGVYPGIHNINNNINNININNINYDVMRYPRGFNNLIALDMGINHQSRKNFYQQNNIINNDFYFDEII